MKKPRTMRKFLTWFSFITKTSRLSRGVFVIARVRRCSSVTLRRFRFDLSLSGGFFAPVATGPGPVPTGSKLPGDSTIDLFATNDDNLDARLLGQSDGYYAILRPL